MSATQTLTFELEKFDAQIEALSTLYDVKAIDEKIFHIFPRNPSALVVEGLKNRGKSLGLTISGIVHGNELAGLQSINLFLEKLVSQTVVVEVPLGVFLGNVDAAKDNSRFLESDLNRSFGVKEPVTIEHKRGKAILPTLDSTLFYLDFHQTFAPTESPFYIFPYQPKAYAFARALAPELPLITHWGKPFSKDGACTDEFVNKNGGAGVTIELGAAGFDLMQSALGFRYCVEALEQATLYLKTGQFVPREVDQVAKIYTFAKVEPFPEGGKGALFPGHRNMMPVDKEDVLGKWENQDIVAGEKGLLLFPKYVTAKDRSRPTEMFRVLREVSESELPK